MAKQDKNLQRQAAPKAGGAGDENAQFDFLQDTETSEMAHYDEAESFDDKGSERPKDDKLEFENGLPAPTKISSGGKKVSTIDLKKASVAAKIASLLLPHANAEAIENQAALFLRYLPATALSDTLERCWFDRQGAKIAAQRLEVEKKRQASEASKLERADKLGSEALSVTADDQMAEVSEEETSELAEELSEEGAVSTVEDQTQEVISDEVPDIDAGAVADEGCPVEEGMDSTANDESEEVNVDEMLEEQASAKLATDFKGKKLEAKPISRTASKKPVAGKKPSNPKFGTPQRRAVTAADVRKNEVTKLSEVYSKHLGVPSNEEFDKVASLFAN